MHRKLLLSGGGVSTETESGILHHAVLHPFDADRDVIVDRVLDQQEFRSGASVPRSYHRADNDGHSGHVQRYKRLVSESNRPLVRRLPVSRLWSSARVRLHQRLHSQREKEIGTANVK